MRVKVAVAIALRPVRLDDPRPPVHDPFPAQALSEQAPAQHAVRPRVAPRHDARHALQEAPQHGVAGAGVAHQSLSQDWDWTVWGVWMSKG